ncbi:hypothetical protein [Candidatus Cyanaurora vandensis]|uniref:hypothetical protein n=1 Tax=Candidatus Cyanaurora vandensis TaxID=2714958 RepID=UPI00257EC876|nr:hypothetical protein [Candidatus Cyanaurora vandensis]
MHSSKLASLGAILLGSALVNLTSVQAQTLFSIPPQDIYEQCTNPRLAENPVRYEFCNNIIFPYVCTYIAGTTGLITDPLLAQWVTDCEVWTDKVSSPPPGKVSSPPPG